MRILYTIHQFLPDSHSGTEQHCLAVAREARRRGDEPVILCLHWDHDRDWPPIRRFEQPVDGLRVIRLNHWRRINPNDQLRDYQNLHLEGWFQQVLDEVRPDVVHAFHLRQLGSNLLRVAKRNGLRICVTLMDFWYLCPRFTLQRSDGTVCDGPPDQGRGCVPCHAPELQGAEPDPAADPLTDSQGARLHALLSRKERQFQNLALADVIFAPSRFLADVFRNNGFDHGGFRLGHYGLEAGRVTRAAVARPRSPLRIGFCGILSPWKGPDLVVDAVRGSGLDCRLTIHGRLEEAMFQEYIDSLVASAEGDPRIRFAGGYSEEQISEVFAEMDVLVVASTWYENTPLVVFEAFAAGVPVLVADLGGMSEMVTERNGLVFEAGSVESLRAQLRRIATDREWWRRLDVQPLPGISDCYERYRAAYER